MVWLYGLHAALAAAANPSRRLRRLVAIADLADRLSGAASASGTARPPLEIADRRTLDALLSPGAVHQGIAVLAEPLAEMTLHHLLSGLDEAEESLVVVLDQAEDPRNVGAVLRSAAAFGARAVVVQDRHAPDITGALAKAASGAVERVPLIRVTNVARALRLMQDAGFWCVGLDGRATAPLATAELGERTALVLGSEGSGLRRLVRDTCDVLVYIPIDPAIESLNLSTAAAIALYERARREHLKEDHATPSRPEGGSLSKREFIA